MTTIPVRNVPEELSRELKARAAAEGRSLSDYLLRALTSMAARPSREALLDRIQTRAVRGLPPAADMLGRERHAS